MRSAWDLFRYLETEPAARTFLADAYGSLGIERPERAAFQQSSRFLYVWKQARTYYDAASQSGLLIRPLLLFYGCVCLLKGAVIARDPDYPQNSRVLQHGVTTRKLKKQPYRLLEDDVRMQKEGLLPHAVKVLKADPPLSACTAAELFSFVPELAQDVRLCLGRSDWIPAELIPSSSVLTFPAASEGPLGYSIETFVQYLNRLSPPGMRFEPSPPPSEGPPNRSVQKHLRLVAESAASNRAAGVVPLARHPLFAQTGPNTYLFWTGTEPTLPPTEWCTHYCLLYLLSMLCRYETEWWGELVLSQSIAEVYLVDRFLAVHEEVFPALVADLLQM